MDNPGYREDSTSHVDIASHADSSTDSSVVGVEEPCYHRVCACCARDRYPYPSPADSSWRERCVYDLCLCPPYGDTGNVLTFVLTSGLLWASMWAIIGDDALPGGNIFGIVALFLVAIVCGKIVGLAKPLPPLLGMLIAGVCLRNIPGINVAANIHEEWSSILRAMALVVILIRAGLALDWDRLKHMSFGALRLSFIPCLVETATVTVTSKYIFSAFLIDFPWTWAFMLGFVHSAVSPGVVVPSMLALQAIGLGVDKGIPTLLIAAGTLDDVIAINGFSLVLSITFSDVSLVWDILRAPAEVLLGISYGVLIALLCIHIPSLMRKNVHGYRFVMLLLCGLFGQFGAKYVNVEGAGALGVLVLASVTGHGWSTRVVNPNLEDPVPVYFSNLWLIFQPLLFGLIGAALDLSHLNYNIIAWGSLVLMLGLAARMAATFFAVVGVGLNPRERLFTTLAWLPKATVQAAIGSLALDAAYRVDASPDDVERGVIILALSVFMIIITAPVGAVLIAVTAKHLLTVSQPHELTPHVSVPSAKISTPSPRISAASASDEDPHFMELATDYWNC